MSWAQRTRRRAYFLAHTQPISKRRWRRAVLACRDDFLLSHGDPDGEEFQQWFMPYMRLAEGSGQSVLNRARHAAWQSFREQAACLAERALTDYLRVMQTESAASGGNASGAECEGVEANYGGQRYG